AFGDDGGVAGRRRRADVGDVRRRGRRVGRDRARAGGEADGRLDVVEADVHRGVAAAAVADEADFGAAGALGHLGVDGHLGPLGLAGDAVADVGGADLVPAGGAGAGVEEADFDRSRVEPAPAAGAPSGDGKAAAAGVDLVGVVPQADALRQAERLIASAGAPLGAAGPGEAGAVVAGGGRVGDLGGGDVDAAAPFELPFVHPCLEGRVADVKLVERVGVVVGDCCLGGIAQGVDVVSGAGIAAG